MNLDQNSHRLRIGITSNRNTERYINCQGKFISSITSVKKKKYTQVVNIIMYNLF